jgi:hypothetical protein
MVSLGNVAQRRCMEVIRRQVCDQAFSCDKLIDIPLLNFALCDVAPITSRSPQRFISHSRATC